MQVFEFSRQLPRCVVSVEVRREAHFLAQEIAALGRAFRVIPPVYGDWTEHGGQAAHIGTQRDPAIRVNAGLGPSGPDRKQPLRDNETRRHCDKPPGFLAHHGKPGPVIPRAEFGLACSGAGDFTG